MSRLPFAPGFLFATILVLVSCRQQDEEPFRSGRPDSKVWLVPSEEVVDAGIGKDGIPSVDAPMFTRVSEVPPYFDDDLVLGVEHDGIVQAYPIPMLNWHEIINDEVNGLPIAVTYCPLTGTGIGWSRLVNGAETTYGVSGLLYNSNLMPYDRLTESTWSQQRLECVNGRFIGERPAAFTLIETTFRTWKRSFPNSLVMNANTGFDRRYSVYPYGDYRTNQDLLFFPVSGQDGRLPAKERVLGVIVGDAIKAYRFNTPDDDLQIIIDLVGNKRIIVIRSEELQILTAFYPLADHQYHVVTGSLPILFRDDKDNNYDLAGRIISGPNLGVKLTQPVAFMGFWFSWAAFYPQIEIYSE